MVFVPNTLEFQEPDDYQCFDTRNGILDVYFEGFKGNTKINHKKERLNCGPRVVESEAVDHIDESMLEKAEETRPFVDIKRIVSFNMLHDIIINGIGRYIVGPFNYGMKNRSACNITIYQKA